MNLTFLQSLHNPAVVIDSCRSGNFASLMFALISASPGARPSQGFIWVSTSLFRMPLIPRWRYMSDEAKALTKRTAVSALVAMFFLLVLRALIPWVLLALVAWWIWAAVKK